MDNTPQLNRRIPSSWKHVTKYPLRGVMQPTRVRAELILDVPLTREFRVAYDQGSEGACVGYSQSWMMSILNGPLYDAPKLYAAAQLLDEWPETPPEGGTSLSAGFDVLRTVGHWRIGASVALLADGIAANRWATTVDEIRTALVARIPVNLGIWWYESFFAPVAKPAAGEPSTSTRREYWIGTQANWGQRAGGHAITAVGASDYRQALALCNTWGFDYPFLVWVPYKAVTRLLREDGEAGIVTDR